MVIAPNTVRWVMGPAGTTVIFPKDEGLPSIFNQKPCRLGLFYYFFCKFFLVSKLVTYVPRGRIHINIVISCADMLVGFLCAFSYPPPREKCAGPSCVNPYKYRDSKSNLPLCSLRCYRAIHQMAQPVTT